MGFTQTELDALKEAYAAGALRIVHEGKVRRESVKNECWVQGVYTKIMDSNLVFLHQ